MQSQSSSRQRCIDRPRAIREVCDRAPLFSRAFRDVLAQAGVEVVRLPARSPNLNAHAERFVKSVKDECISRIIPLGEKHLRWALSEYLAHYHRERCHQGVGNVRLDRSTPVANDDGEVVCRERLGGYLKVHERRDREA